MSVLCWGLKQIGECIDEVAGGGSELLTARKTLRWVGFERR